MSDALTIQPWSIVFTVDNQIIIFGEADKQNKLVVLDAGEITKALTSDA